MPIHHVNCSIDVTDADTAWAYIREFGSDWHPDIVANTQSVDASGAIVRNFTGSDGGHYREQRTYFSDTDMLMRYVMTEGIEKVKNYQGEAFLSDNTAHWSATFRADDSIATKIAKGTENIFNNGLEWLKNKTGPHKTSNYDTRNSRAQIEQQNISGEVGISILSTVEAGQPCWTLVLFLHGIGGNADNWKFQLDSLDPGCVAASMDLRGYGMSDLGEAQTHIDDYCRDILLVMKHFGARKIVLVGLSMGSWIATSFAMRHPQLLAGLVLAGGCTGMSEANTEEREGFRKARSEPLASGKTPADFASGVVDIIAGPVATKKQRDYLHQSMASISSDTYLDALTCFTRPMEKFDFSRINCPVLLMTGQHDRLAAPDEIRQLSLRIFDEISSAGRLPDIRFEVIQDAGHLCNIEMPAVFNKLLQEFIDRVPGAASSRSPGRQSVRQAKTRNILDAALQEFSAQGYDGASMSSIAGRAGVSKPTLYQYFGDKEALFTAVLQEGCEHIITPLSAPDGKLVDRLWSFSWVYADFVLRADMLSLARLVLGEASRRPQIAETYHKAGPGKAFKGLVKFIEECQAAEELQVDNVEYAAQELWSLILSGPRDHYLHFVDQVPDRQELLGSISHGLRTFIKVYSTDIENDLALLARKIDSYDLRSRSIGG